MTDPEFEYWFWHLHDLGQLLTLSFLICKVGITTLIAKGFRRMKWNDVRKGSIKNVLGKSFWLLSWEQTERSANADCKVIAKIHREADDSLDPESSSGDGTKRLDS